MKEKRVWLSGRKMDDDFMTRFFENDKYCTQFVLQTILDNKPDTSRKPKAGQNICVELWNKWQKKKELLFWHKLSIRSNGFPKNK